MPLKAFIISLPRASRRAAKAMSEAENAGLDYEIVKAVDARLFKDREGNVDWGKLNEAQPFTNDRWGCAFLASEVAIYASHLLVYRRILEENLEGAFVFEDDFCLTGDADYGLQEVSAALDSVDGWFHCTLHHEHLSFNSAYRVTGSEHPLLNRVRQTPLIGVAYAVSAGFCRHFLKHYSFMDSPHDHAVARISGNPHLKFLQTTRGVCGSSGENSLQE